MHNDPKLVVSAQTVVRLAVTLRDDCGETLRTDITQLEVVVGYGQLVPKVERAILGLAVGDRCVLQLQAEEAFGKHDESKVVDFDRQEFPDTVATGDVYDAEADDGSITSLRVLEVHDDYVLVDMNHPLADAGVSMHLEILAIRPADRRDMEAIDNARQMGQLRSSEQLLPLNRLLKGHTQR